MVMNCSRTLFPEKGPIDAQRYLSLLEPWPAAMRRSLHEPRPGVPRLCYGTGTHGHWAIQANNTAAAGVAVLAADEATDVARTGMSRDELHALALAMIRFALTSHHAGGDVTTDGESWGHSWISALCLERLMHALDALAEDLPKDIESLLQRVLISESDWMVDCYHRGNPDRPGKITAGLVTNNVPESNIWNGAILHRTALLYPDAPRVGDYREQGTRFLLNGLSVPADADSREPIAGRPLSEWHVGANVFPSMACNHHGYLNVGYLVISLSNIAMLHFSCRARGWDPPPGLYHHAAEVWRFVKTCTFPDGRLWRIGGDTRARYCYCQDYAIAAWLLARDALGDRDTEAFEQGWLNTVRHEQETNGDGSFLSARLADLADVSPLYYTRLEGDRAGSLSMGAAWRRLMEQKPLDTVQSGHEKYTLLDSWQDEYHASVLIRSAKRLASWTWGAAEPPQGMLLPPEASNMAEWCQNLSGRIVGLGLTNINKCRPSQSQRFEGGFATCGKFTVRSEHHMAEGELPADIAEVDLAAVALPDDRGMVVFQRARAIHRAWFRQVKGLHLLIPNDIFNASIRTYRHCDDELTLEALSPRDEIIPVPGNWLAIEDKLVLVKAYGEPLAICRPAQRQITLKGKPHLPGSLHADEIVCGCRIGTQDSVHDQVLFDLGVVLSLRPAKESAEFATKVAPIPRETLPDEVRGVTLGNRNGGNDLVLVNFGAEGKTVAMPWPEEREPEGLGGIVPVEKGRGRLELTLPAGHAGMIL